MPFVIEISPTTSNFDIGSSVPMPTLPLESIRSLSDAPTSTLNAESVPTPPASFNLTPLLAVRAPSAPAPAEAD